MAFARVAAPFRILQMGIIDMDTKASRQCVDRLFELLQHGDLSFISEERVPVVVEAQPADGACKVMTHGMQMFFLKHSLQHAYTHHFQMMAPNSKLLTVPEFYADMPHETRAQRKEIAMRTAEALMKTSERNAKFMAYYNANLYKQRTDLADALAQAARFLQLHNDESAAFLRANINLNDNWETRSRRMRKEQQRSAHPDEFRRGAYDASVNRRAPTADDTPWEHSDVQFADDDDDDADDEKKK